LTKISQRRRKIWNSNRNDPKYSNTSIEVAVQNYLKKLGIPFKTQVHLPGIPDIFIEPNIVVFCDGCYWHKCILCGYGKRGRYIDKRVNERLEGQGYIVLRFWEHEINHDIRDCIKRITEKMEK
jgi:DNA mismatch endonuclease (patch repair protein)